MTDAKIHRVPALDKDLLPCMVERVPADFARRLEQALAEAMDALADIEVSSISPTPRGKARRSLAAIRSHLGE